MSNARERRALAFQDVRRTCEYVPTGTQSNGSAEEAASSANAFWGLRQERFENALAAGVESNDPFTNIFISGLSGLAGFDATRRHALRAIEVREKKGDKAPELCDWVYVHNFEKPRSPIPIPLKRGKGKEFWKRTALLLKRLRQEVPARLDGSDVLARKNALQSDYEAWYVEEREKLSARALELGFVMESRVKKGTEHVYFTTAPSEPRESAKAASNPAQIPARMKDKARTKDKKNKKSTPAARVRANAAPERGGTEKKPASGTAVSEHLAELNGLLGDFSRENMSRSKRMREEMELIEGDAARETIADVFETFHASSGNSLMGKFVAGLRTYAEDHWEIFVEGDAAMVQPQFPAIAERDRFLPWRVNVFVDNSETEGIPVIAEHMTSVTDLIGRIEYRGVMGMPFTDHTMVVNGALARADGGFIVISVDDLATVPGLWPSLKQCIKTHSNVFNEMLAYGYGGSQLDPVPVSLNVRVILFGSRDIMELIAHYDGEFRDLFPLRAELTPFVAHTIEEVSAYCGWMQSVAYGYGLLSLSSDACQTLIEHAGRLADHQNRLSTDFAELGSVIQEAGVIARRENADMVEKCHVQKALHARFWRSDIVYEYMREAVRESTYLIAVSDEAVGKINGLTVLSRGDISFGFPCCITAGVSVGKPGVVNIVRDAKLSGNIMNKADETVQGVLEGRFAQKTPLAVKIRFSFEQTYGMIDGDSASLGEYFVILSRVAGIPLAQSIAVTGSMNLLGDVQPIGGVNEKIEGFFDVCRACGELSGEQGVIIPWQNKANLMLREDVVEAVKAGAFHVWAIRTPEEGIEILSGIPAGELRQDGTYEEGTFYARVCGGFETYAKRAKDFESKKE